MSDPEQSGQQGHVAFDMEEGLKKSVLINTTVVEAVVATRKHVLPNNGCFIFFVLLIFFA